MPVTFSSKKALRRDRRRRQVNQKIKSALKKTVSKFKKKPTKQNLSSVYQFLDRATKKNVFQANKSARIKSTLAKRLIAKQ